MKNIMDKKQYIWKWLFFSLLIVNISVIAIIFSLVFLVGREAQVDTYERKDNSSFQAYMSLQFTPTQLNEWLKEEWSHEQVNIYFGQDTIQTEVSFDIFGQTTHMFIAFQPKVLPDGNVGLTETSFSLGGFSVPPGMALSALQSQVDVPSYVEVYPNDRFIVIRLDQISFKGDYYLKAKEVDLEKGSIELLVGK